MVRRRAELGNPGEPFEIALYTTAILDDDLGRVPELIVADYLANNFDALGVNYRIYWNFDDAPPLTNTNTACGPIYDDWGEYLRNDAPYIARDSNLLLVHTSGGGCGSVTGNVAVVGVEDLDHEIFPLPENMRGERGGWGGNLYSALHEIGHNLGFTPGGNKQFGRTWVSDDLDTEPVWNKTPCIGRRDASENWCGDPIDPDNDPGQQDRLWFEYHDCLVEKATNKTDEPVTITRLDFSPQDPVAGGTVEIDVTCQNNTPTAYAATFDVLVDGSWIDTLSFRPAGFDSETETTTWRPDAAGNYTIEVGDASISVSVEAEGELRVVALDVTPAEPTVRETAVIEATMQNTTDQFEATRRDVVVSQPNRGSETIGEVFFQVDPHDTDTGTVPWTPERAGDTRITVGEQSITVTVGDRPDEGEVRILDVSLADPPATVGVTELIKVHAENPGSTQATRNVKVKAGGNTLQVLTFDLEPGEEAIPLVSWTPRNEGQVTITAGGSSTVVDVEQGDGGSPPPEEPVIPIDPMPVLASLAGGTVMFLLIGAPEGRTPEPIRRFREGIQRRLSR